MRPYPAFVCLCLAACATTSPRFEQDVATTFAQDDMRRLQTEDVELYYPAEYADQARRVAARATECVRELRKLQKTKRDHGRVLLFLTSDNYNNAYVGGQSGGEPLHSLNALSVTEEIFHWYGFSGSDTGDIACHEMFHFVHFEQVENLWRLVNDVFGPVVPSQAFLERWFTEGMAQYYEGRIARNVGRPHSPLYQGSFDSYVASRGGELGGGDLSLYQRELSPYSGAYLTGLYFVEWLAQKYGEEKLWRLMDVQGRSVFSPFGATLRFKKVYGLSAGALLDQWTEELKQVPVRERLPSQRVLSENVGQFARIATHPATGTIAMISSGVEDVATLRILSADGTVKVERKLALFGPGRDWIITSPLAMSGLSFSGDGRFLFVMNDDYISRGDTRAQLWKLDVATGDTVQVWQELGRGMGGAVSADGRTYTYTLYDPSGGSKVVDRDLESGVEKVVLEGPPSIAIASPAWSPDHSRLLVSLHDALGWNLVLVSPGGERRVLTADGEFNYAGKWLDDHQIIFARAAGPYLQAHRLDVDTGRLERLSDTPYGVIDPSPLPGAVAVVNRTGSHWSLDVLPDSAQAVVQEAFPLDGAQPVAPDRHEPTPLAVESDEPYSSFDHLFLPQLRVPAVLFSLGPNAAGNTAIITSLYASLSGKDRLSHHNWAINGMLNLPTLENSLQVGYQNMQLAPYSITAAAQRDGYLDETLWSGAISVDRTFFTSPVSFGVQTEIDDLFGSPLARYIGPFASVSYAASESTPYGGTQRLLAFSLDVAGYGPGSTRSMADVRLGLTLAAPLPISKRHSFVVTLAGRTLPGAPDGALRIGGVASGTSLYSSERTTLTRGPGEFLPGSLVEFLRGYEDHSIRATAAGLGQVRYRYSFIIDKGFMSLLYIFPSIFFRQVDAELFGSAAITNGTERWARAVGGSVIVRTLFGGAFPFSLYYQFAYRFDFGLKPLHTVGFAFQ